MLWLVFQLLGVLVISHCMVPFGTRCLAIQERHPILSMSYPILLKGLQGHSTKWNVTRGISHALDGVQGNFQTGFLAKSPVLMTKPSGLSSPVGSHAYQSLPSQSTDMDFSPCFTMTFSDSKESLDFHRGSWTQELLPVAPVTSAYSLHYRTTYRLSVLEWQMENMQKYKASAQWNCGSWILKRVSLPQFALKTYYTSQKYQLTLFPQGYYGITAEYQLHSSLRMVQ